MEKIRKGNDIEVKWAIYAGQGINETPYDLTGKNISLYLRNKFGRTEIYEYTVDKHVIQFMIWGKDQQQTGTYSIELIENEGRRGMHTVDECDAFSLVNHSCQTGGESEGRVECIHLQFRANMGVSVPAIGAEITVDDALSLASENPVQNKVITLALQDEVKRAEDAESRLEKVSEDNTARLVLVEDSVRDVVTRCEGLESRLTRIEDALRDVDISEVANVLVKVESLESDINVMEADIEALESDMEKLNADASVDGSVSNKIAQALNWDYITE